MIFIFWGVTTAHATHATTYHVDARSGSDQADGATPATAWRSMARVNQARLVPGDLVLFARGGVWRETLMPPSSGQEDRPIVFGAYGQGPRPLILGSVDRSGEDNWTAEGQGLWYCSGVDWKPNYFQLRQGMIFHDGIGSTQKPRKEDLRADWDWWIDPENSRAYVRLGHNPGRHRIEVQQRMGIGFTGANHIVVRDLEIAYCEIGIALWQAQGWTIEHCFIHDVVVDAIHINGPAASPPRRNIVRNCEFVDWNWKGYNLTQHNWQDWGKSEPFMGYGVHVFQGDEHQVIGNRFAFVNMYSGMDSSPIAFDDGGHASLIEGNYVDGAMRMFGPTTGIMLWATRGNSPVVIRGNCFRDLGGLGIIVQDFGRYRFAQPVTIENNVLVNTCWGDSLDQEVIRVWANFAGAGTVTVRNNVVFGVRKGQHAHHGIRVRQSKAIIENNTVIGADRGISIERNSTAEVRNNISTANRQAAVAVEPDSKIVSAGNCYDGRVEGFAADATDRVGAVALRAPDRGEYAPVGDECQGKGADVSRLPAPGANIAAGRQ